jgi:ABC-type siderophore export system fused ATPase/permease subunit
MTTGSSEPHDIVSQNTTGERNLAELSADITNIIATINKINESISTHFISLSYNMATIGITTLLSSISVIVAILIGFINVFVNYYVKKKIEDLHTNILNESTIKFSNMIDEARNDLSKRGLATKKNDGPIESSASVRPERS